MRVYSIKDKLYQITYKIYIGDDEEELVKRSGVNLSDNSFTGFTSIVDDHIVLGFVEQEGFTTGLNTIVHEAFHAMFYTFTIKGLKIETTHHEHVSYYLGWLVDEIWKIVQKHERNNNNREKSNTE